VGWTVETLDETVDAEIEALPEDMRARLAHVARLIEEKDLERVGEPHVKHIEGRLWEMRLKGPQRHIAGALCDRCWAPGGDCASFCEEDGEDTTKRDRAGAHTREISSVMEVSQWRG
jgi:hypothetical protein